MGERTKVNYDFVKVNKLFIKILRNLSGRKKLSITTEEYNQRQQKRQFFKPLVENEDQESGILRGGAITRNIRRRQVDGYDEDSALKQARLRDVSEHHLYRQRRIAPTQEATTDKVALVHNANVVSIHRHIVEILKFQNCQGAYFNSLNEAQKENIQQQIADNLEGK